MAKQNENTRNNIKKSAYELFATQGFHGTSMSQIATQAEVSKGLAYNYFSSKEELLGEILEETFLDSIAHSDRLMGIISTIHDPHKRIITLINYYIDLVSEHQTFYRLYFSLILQPHVIKNLSHVLEKLKPRTDQIQEQIFTLLREAGSEDPEAEAMLIKSMINGILMNAMSMGNEFPLERVRKLLLDRYGLVNQQI